MIVEITKNQIICKREEKDPKFYGIKEAKGESNFLYFIKTHLNKMIEKNKFLIRDKNTVIYIPNIPTFIKTRMWKDGHLVDDMQQYLRSKKPFFHNETQKKCMICIYNNYWGINGIEEDWNNGEAVLSMEFAETI